MRVRGQFRLENRGSTALTADVTEAWLELPGERRPLPKFTVYDTDVETMVEQHGLSVEAQHAKGFLIGFPRVAYEPSFGASVKVRVRVHAGGLELTAASPVSVARRIPP